MPNEMEELDDVFRALAHPTRRAVLDRLGRGSASMTDLAEPFEMALPSFLQHLQVLERSGLVSSEKTGRVRTFQLQPQALLLAEHWIDARRAQWEDRLNRLDDLLLRLKDPTP